MKNPAQINGVIGGKAGIHQAIRKIREQKCYSQEYMAYKLGISQNAYSKTELGLTTITLTRLFEIAKILEIDALELLDDQKESSS